MPLPDGTLSLHVSNAVQSKPKRAMIVRMSAETLDALDAFPNHPPLSFDFTNPGIHIGDAFFPMLPQKESSPHELYLRVASASKPMAPLKLYANVIGKFRVKPQLGDKVTDKVRHRNMVAREQHMERQAILLEQPPVLPTKNQKRKALSVAKKTDQQLRVPRKPSPLPPPPKANPDLRRRLVQFLAISERLADDVVKMVGGANISASAREDLLALLEDVAEQQPPAKKGDKSPRTWSLKPQSWTEVRPFEWPKLTESTRITMARKARMAFKALGIPESDPAWDNVRYRPTVPAIPTSVPAPPPVAASSSSRSSTSAQAEAKRTATTAKDVKLKPKQDPPRAKGEIQMKDESAKHSASRSIATKRSEMDRSAVPSDSTNAVKTVASRRLPGSGYQAKRSPQPSAAAPERSGTPVDARSSLPASLPPKPSPAAPVAGGSYARKTIPTMPPKPMKKEDESDRERDRENDRQREREREKRAREKERVREERERERAEMEKMEKREKAKQKEREAVDREKRQKEKERERERDEIEPDKRQKEKERISREKAAGGTVPVFKRKTAVQDADESLDDTSAKVSKRRKLDDGSSVVPPRARDADLANKPPHEPSPVPRIKMKKDPSPQSHVSTQDRRVTASASGLTNKSERPSKTSGSVKQRRRSPIYTSSEDEGEIPQPRKHNPSPAPISDRSNSSDQPSSEKPSVHRRAPRAYPPASDHAALRALYQSQYTTYLGTFSKVVAQKRKIEAMLNGDSEAEMDTMDPEELIKLSLEHKTLKTELEHIHDIYTKGTAGVVGGLD